MAFNLRHFTIFLLGNLISLKKNQLAPPVGFHAKSIWITFDPNDIYSRLLTITLDPRHLPSTFNCTRTDNICKVTDQSNCSYFKFWTL